MDGTNSWLKARTQYIKEKKIVKVSGLLQWNLDNSDRRLLNGLPLKIVLYPQKDCFVLMSDDVSREYRVRIIESQLCVRCVKLSDEKYKNIQPSLPATVACYPIKVTAFIFGLMKQLLHQKILGFFI